MCVSVCHNLSLWRGERDRDMCAFIVSTVKMQERMNEYDERGENERMREQQQQMMMMMIAAGARRRCDPQKPL